MTAVSCPPADYDSDRGTAFLAVDGIFTVLPFIFLVLRLYSRAFLTRSFGSDDVTITIAFALCAFGSAVDSRADVHGFGRHCAFLSSEDIGQAQKWIYITWLNGFLAYFFVRASVMLFTLRLLPRTKTRSQWVIYVNFFLNFAITLIASVSFGLQCQPFTAIWDPKPGSKCLSPTILAITTKVNGILACIIDITTACVPAVLLWKVQMKRKTKFILDVIFALGVVTAGLSIGRAVLFTQETIQTDVTWRIVVPQYFSLFESKLGLMLACCPAVRQMTAYCRRTGSCLPTKDRQPPNSDFTAMRHRINVRDWFWRGKHDPARAQGLINAANRSSGSEGSAGPFGLTDPEDSSLSELQHRIVRGASQV